MSKPYNLAEEKKLTRQRELERRVLHQLKNRQEPVVWDELYVHFDIHGTGEIEAVLRKLKDRHYIDVDHEKNVRVTEVGLKRLEAGMF
jgi:hypothetical protein